ncbi:MAG: GDP-mannose 4,6-dehydratase [Candidatus Aenigmarchaeota archaeon]|nr:GDP-mannose 4,6-dehydratase [Candidatus Aenigmarchaeota archaeon]
MADLESKFNGRTVFVTGADGFIGSHLTEKLVSLGAKVHVFVESTAHGTLTNIGHVADKVVVHRGNLTDAHSLFMALKKIKESAHDKTYIMHLAAQAHVGESWERPVETIMSNTMGTFNLLQAIVDSDIDVEKVDYAGTSEEYGNNLNLDNLEDETIHLHEDSPVNPKSIYATSKLAGDFLTMNFFHAYGLPGVVTRMFNNYGPRQSPRYITGTIITQALCRDNIILGNLTPRRDFCFVEDGVRGHMHTTLMGKPGEIYCYGYGNDISIQGWADLILKIGKQNGYWGDKKLSSTKTRFRPGESDVLRLKVGFTKLNKLTGWTPQVTWEEGILRTIDWYSKNKDKWVGLKDW